MHVHAHTHRNRKGYDATHLMCQSSHLSCVSKISLKMASVPSSFIVPRLQGDDKASSLVAWALCSIFPRWQRRSLGMRKIMAVRDKGSIHVSVASSVPQTVYIQYMLHYYACCKLKEGSAWESGKKGNKKLSIAKYSLLLSRSWYHGNRVCCMDTRKLILHVL